MAPLLGVLLLLLLFLRVIFLLNELVLQVVEKKQLFMLIYVLQVL